MNRNKYYLSVAVLIVFVVVIYFLFNLVSLGIETKEIAVNIEVGDHIGFNVDNRSLEFGMIFPGGVGTRNLTIANNVKPRYVTVMVKGSIKNWVGVSENSFIIYPNQSKTINVILTVPKDASYGKYNSKLVLNMRNV